MTTSKEGDGCQVECDGFQKGKGETSQDIVGGFGSLSCLEKKSEHR